MSEPATLLGSLCSGIGGLDLAVERVYGTRLAWTSDPDPAAADVLAARFGVPNLGDITQVDWTRVPRVHVISCGAPCQPFSFAGKRKGTDDPRYLWPHVTEALRHLVPDLFVMEQVPGYISLGLQHTLDDLAALGFDDIRWGVVAASDAGCCHQRKRLFLTAAHPQGLRRGAAADPPLPLPARRAPREVPGGGSRRDHRCTHQRAATPAAHPHGLRRQQGLPWPPLLQRPHAVLAGRRHQTPAHPTRERHRHTRTTRDTGLSAAPVPARAPHHGAGPDWREYTDAIRLWETVIRRPAPHPADEHRRLRPEFVEWLQAFPDGYTDLPGLSRSTRLRLLGGSVNQIQGALALRLLHDLNL